MLEMVNAKYACEINISFFLLQSSLMFPTGALRNEGFTFLGMSPGVVWTFEDQGNILFYILRCRV